LVLFIYVFVLFYFFFFFSSRRRHTRLQGDWSSDVCSSDLSHWRISGTISVLRASLCGDDRIVLRNRIFQCARLCYVCRALRLKHRHLSFSRKSAARCFRGNPAPDSLTRILVQIDKSHTCPSLGFTLPYDLAAYFYPVFRSWESNLYRGQVNGKQRHGRH